MERDNQLRLTNAGRLAAVGLLGSDVYDKLELLRGRLFQVGLLVLFG